MPDRGVKERTCPVCKRLVDENTEPHVRQALLDLEGRWIRPHWQSYHLECHLLVPANGHTEQVVLPL